MKSAIIISFLTFSFLLIISVHTQPANDAIQAPEAGSHQTRMPDLAYYDYPYNRFGDCNGDGWCNFGDLVALIECWRETGPMVCMPAGDMDNDEQITLFDIVLAMVLGGIVLSLKKKDQD